VRVAPDQSFISCGGGNTTGPVYTFSMDSFKKGSPAVVYETKTKPHVFSNGICFNKQGTLFAVSCTDFLLLHEVAKRQDYPLAFPKTTNCCFTEDGGSVVATEAKVVFRVDDLLTTPVVKWKIARDKHTTAVACAGGFTLIAGGGETAVIDNSSGQIVQTLPIEARESTGITSFLLNNKLCVFICNSHFLTLWVLNAQNQFVQLGRLLDLTYTTDTALKTFVNPSRSAYLVFTAFGVVLKFRFADLVAFADAAQEGKEHLEPPAVVQSLRVPIALEDAHVLPEGDAIMLVSALRVTTYQRGINYVSAVGMNLWNV